METMREWFERWQAEFAWQMEGSCYDTPPGVDEGWFVPGPAFDPVRAARTCASCPIKQRCGEYADEHPQMYGVWGGTVRGRVGDLVGDTLGTHENHFDPSQLAQLRADDQ